MSAISEFSSVIGLMFVGSGFKLPDPTVGGKGLRPLGKEFKLVGIGLTSEGSRQELATKAMARSGCGLVRPSTSTRR